MNKSFLFSLVVHMFILSFFITKKTAEVNQEIAIEISLMALPEEATITAKQEEIKLPKKEIVKTTEITKKIISEYALKQEKEEIVEQQKTSEEIKQSSYIPVKYKLGSNSNPIPTYPRIALRKKQEGKVLVCAEVNKYGIAENVSLCNSSGYTALDHAALKTIRKWKFTTNKNKMQNNLATIEIPIIFSLRKA